MRHEYDKQADRRIILGPIFKYAAIGVSIGIVFITGTVMLEHKVNTFEQDISELKSQLARKNKEENELTTAAVAQQQTSLQSQLATQIEPSASEARKAPFASDAENHDTVRASTAPANETIRPDNVDPLASAVMQPEAVINNSTALEGPFQAWSQSVTIRHTDTAEYHDQTEVSPPAAEQSPPILDMESFEFEQSPHLTHLEWIRQQRLKHERWLEAIEQRREDTFDTRKASQFNKHDSANAEARTSM